MIKLLVTVLGCFFCAIGILSSQKLASTPDSLAPQAGKKRVAASIQTESRSYQFDGRDGPFIFEDSLFRVDSSNRFWRETFYRSDTLSVEVDNAVQDAFEILLSNAYKVPKSSYVLPDRVVVISDIEGNFDAFSSFLMANGIIDENYDWTYKSGHLVLLGDFVDRGENVTQVLWLVYKLEKQARLKKGGVHFILGNHEVLNFQGDYRYNQIKYIKVAQKISGKKDEKEALKYIYSSKSELGKWLSTKNVIEKIGTYLFVHGGLSSEILKYDLTLDEINDRMRKSYYADEVERDETTRFLYSGLGPLWYRGMVNSRPTYDLIRSNSLAELLEFYGSEKIVVGHTFVKDISSSYEGRILMTDVPHGKKKFSGKTKGLLIEKRIEYIIDDIGIKTLLKK